jgi:hypothetical protein
MKGTWQAMEPGTPRKGGPAMMSAAVLPPETLRGAQAVAPQGRN